MQKTKGFVGGLRPLAALSFFRPLATTRKWSFSGGLHSRERGQERRSLKRDGRPAMRTVSRGSVTYEYRSTSTRVHTTRGCTSVLVLLYSYVTLPRETHDDVHNDVLVHPTQRLREHGDAELDEQSGAQREHEVLLAR